MADTVVAASLTLNAEQANQSVKTFKSQLREAQQSLVAITEKFGDTSKEAAIAAKRVAELKDRMGDANKLVDGFNPDRKFQAFSNALSGVAGGFAALQGVMALVGAESEDVQKSLLKVQAALAISQGVNNILELRDTFKQLGTVIQASTVYQKANNLITLAAAAIQKLFTGAVNQTSFAFKALKGAIIATGIGALIIAVGFLIEKIQEWTSSTDDQEKAQERLKAATDQLNESLEFSTNLQNRYTKENIAQAKARGAAESELQKIERQGFESRIFFAETALRDAKAKGVDTLQFEERLSVEKQNLRIFDFEQQGKLLEKQTDLAKKARDKELADAKAAREKFLQERMTNEQQAEEQIKKLRIQAQLDAIKDEDERNKQRILLENRLERERVNNLNLSGATKIKLIQEINNQEEAELDRLENEKTEKQKERDAERIEAGMKVIQDAIELRRLQIQAQNELQLEIDAGQRTALEQQLFELDAWYKEKQKIAGDNEILQNELTADYERQRTLIVKTEALNRLQIVSGILGKASELFGKQTAAGKVLAIAEATINTYAGATLALREKSTLPQPFSTIQKIASVALIIATGLKSINAIAKAKVPGGGGGSAPSFSADAAAPLTPTPQVGTTALDQASLNQIGNATVRAFVVEADVTNNQERIIRLNRQARLGG
jgi:hypothetical protein